MQDPFTSAPTCICGRNLPPPGERSRLRDDHRRRLEAFDRLRSCAAECGITTDPDRDIVTLPEDDLILLERGDPVWARLGNAIRAWRALVPLLPLPAFGFSAEAENPLEEPNSLMRQIGGGVEAWVFLAHGDGSAYKFYRPLEGPEKKIGSAFGLYRGEETTLYAEARAGTYRELLEKLLLIDGLEGMPTEVMAVTPEGIVIVKQTVGSLLEQHADVSTRLPEGLIEIPSRFLRANRDHPRLLFCDERPYLIADLHARNLVLASDNTLRTIDLVACSWTTDGPGSDRMISDWISRLRVDPTAALLAPNPDDEL